MNPILYRIAISVGMRLLTYLYKRKKHLTPAQEAELKAEEAKVYAQKPEP